MSVSFTLIAEGGSSGGSIFSRLEFVEMSPTSSVLANVEGENSFYLETFSHPPDGPVTSNKYGIALPGGTVFPAYYEQVCRLADDFGLVVGAGFNYTSLRTFRLAGSTMTQGPSFSLPAPSGVGFGVNRLIGFGPTKALMLYGEPSITPFTNALRAQQLVVSGDAVMARQPDYGIGNTSSTVTTWPVSQTPNRMMPIDENRVIYNYVEGGHNFLRVMKMAGDYTTLSFGAPLDLGSYDDTQAGFTRLEHDNWMFSIADQRSVLSGNDTEGSAGRLNVWSVIVNDKELSLLAFSQHALKIVPGPQTLWRQGWVVGESVIGVRTSDGTYTTPAWRESLRPKGCVTSNALLVYPADYWTSVGGVVGTGTSDNRAYSRLDAFPFDPEALTVGRFAQASNLDANGNGTYTWDDGRPIPADALPGVGIGDGFWARSLGGNRVALFSGGTPAVKILEVARG